MEQLGHVARVGHVSYRPEDGLKVRLLGAFDNLSVIHGTFEKIPITLVDCVATSTEIRHALEPVAVRQDIEPQLLLYGINLSDPAEPCFKAIDIEIENLSQWSAAQDITLKLEGDDRLPDDQSTDGPIRRTLRRVFRKHRQQSDQAVQKTPTGLAGWGVEGRPVDEHRVQIDDLTAELRRCPSLPNWDEHRDRTVGRIAARSILRFSSTRSRTAKEWEETARMAQDLLSLATFSPCAVLRKTLIPDDAKHASDNTVRSEVHLYAQQLVTGAPNEPAMEPWAMLFNLSDVDFETVLPEWTRVRDTLRPTCNMVLGLKYIPEGYLETKLLTVTGAAEVMEGSLARELKRPLPVPPEKYTVLRKELLCLAPEQYRDWLDKKLYNAPSLQDKLKLLAGQLDTQVTDKLLPNIERWAQQTSRARNDLAHRGESTRVPAVEMSAIVSVTVAVIVVSLLTQLRIPTPRILQALEQHPDLKYAPDLARKYWPAAVKEPSDPSQPSLDP